MSIYQPSGNFIDSAVEVIAYPDCTLAAPLTARITCHPWLGSSGTNVKSAGSHTYILCSTRRFPIASGCTQTFVDSTQPKWQWKQWKRTLSNRVMTSHHDMKLGQLYPQHRYLHMRPRVMLEPWMLITPRPKAIESPEVQVCSRWMI